MEKAVWDAYHPRVFCDIRMAEVNANNSDGGCLRRKGYANLGAKFAEKTRKTLSKKQFKNKWDALKKDYAGWMELQSATGLGWDPETKTMEADDDWWKTHLAVGRPMQDCVSWSRPLSGFAKLNMDAAFHVESCAGATAVVVHDSLGNFIAGSCCYLPHVADAGMAEALALQHGLELADQRGMQRVQPESDSIEVINSCSGQDRISGTALSIFVNCISSVGRIAGVEVVHCPREANKFAHGVS